MKKSILKKAVILSIACVLSVGTLFTTYAAACVHSFNGAYVTVKPTCTMPGYKAAYCNNCAKQLSYTPQGAALGHDYKRTWVAWKYIIACTRCGLEKK